MGQVIGQEVLAFARVTRDMQRLTRDTRAVSETYARTAEVWHGARGKLETFGQRLTQFQDRLDEVLGFHHDCMAALDTTDLNALLAERDRLTARFAQLNQEF